MKTESGLWWRPRRSGARRCRRLCYESLRRLESADGFVAQAEQKVFLRGCLENTLARPDFCEGVPSMSELMKAATWSVANDHCGAQLSPGVRAADSGGDGVLLKERATPQSQKN